MATSGSTDFRSTGNNIIEDALRSLNIIREDEALDAGDSSFALRTLNRMIKGWQAQDVHLWTKKTATVFLQKSQAEYTLNSTTTDHATLSYTATTLDGDYSGGETTINFSDAITGSISTGDNIGIVLDANSIFWDTVATIVDTDTVTINNALPSAASDGKNVYIYTTKLDQPFNVWSAVRENDSGIDVPMLYMSYEDYFQQPNKTTEATPVNYNYDRQLDSARIVVWPVPPDVEFRMKITVAAKIQDFDSVANTPDFPQEWEQALISNLAVKLAPAYGKAAGPNFAELKSQAVEDLALALSYDSEQGSIYLQPNFYG